MWKLPQAAARKLADLTLRWTSVKHNWQHLPGHDACHVEFETDLCIASSQEDADGSRWPMRTSRKTPMRVARKLTKREKSNVENNHHHADNFNSPLHKIPGFGEITHRRAYRKGAVIFSEGQTARGVHVVCTGRVKLSITSAEGRKQIVRLARPGDLLGLSAGLTGAVYEATAETLAPCDLEFVARKDLLSLLEQQQSGGLSIAVAVSKELADFIEHARMLLLSDSATEKLGRLLLGLGDQFGERTSRGIKVQTMLTHEEMAQMIGTSRETVTRSLNTLKRKQLISGNGVVVIRNRSALI